MKTSKSIFFLICLSAGILFSTSKVYADYPILIPPDNGTPPQPGQPHIAFAIVNQNATILQFQETVGMAVISIYDSENHIVYQQTIDTGLTNTVCIPIFYLDPDEYMITIMYGVTIQRGYFSTL